MLMPTPPLVRASEIVDPAALKKALIAAAHLGEGAARAEMVTQLKAVLKQGRTEIERRFQEGQSGAAVLAGNSYLMDVVIRTLYQVVTEAVFPIANPTAGEHMAVVAVGGYGRGELAPFSDIDLLFLLPYKRTPITEQVVEFMLYVLWDLGLKVGHATRSVEDTLRQAKADITIRTSILETRGICGDAELYQTLRRRFQDKIVEGTAAAFVEAKLDERDQRHQRMGDSRYVLEPNVKEGKGGLRDLHSLFWIAKYLFRVETLDALVDLGVLLPVEAQRFARAQNFLWTVRCHLHYLTGRPEERLTFDVQSEIGHRMGYTQHAGSRGVERFMKHYFLVAKDIGDLTRIFIAALDSDQKRASKKQSPVRPLPVHEAEGVEGFTVDGGRLSVAHDRIFAEDPVNLIRLFRVAQFRGFDIHPRALRLVTQSLRLIDAALRADPEANRLFMDILTAKDDPETSLRRMNEAGVFGRFLPDFGRVVAQMQYDMYHVYTVDEHTIFAIGMIQRLENDGFAEELPFECQVMDSIASRRVLYLAVLLHDIAKGRGGDHSELGAKVAQKLGPRLGLDAAEVETVSWLVKEHLVMSRAAFKRDLDDPKTIHNFVDIVQSPERLKLLYLLTVADIRAVGPTVWNNWKGELLRRLYTGALELMSGGVIGASREAEIARRKDTVRQFLTDFSDDTFRDFVDRTYPHYWRLTDPMSIARHARLMREADRTKAPLSVATRVDLQQAITEVTVYTPDHAGLFSRLAGALALAGALIVDARIVTMANGMALDTFWVQDLDGGAFDRPDKLAKLSVMFENVLSGDLKPQIELKRKPAFPSRTQVFTVPPRVLIDNKASSSYTVIEINGRDRPALLYDLTRELTRLGVQIIGAKIATYGEKVVDVFFVKDLFGMKIDSESRLAALRKALIEALKTPEAESKPKAKLSA
jgi:[protein-PII] uridylyltransferase